MAENITPEELRVRFSYHPPFGDLPEKYERVRNEALAFALLIRDYVPDSRERALAITKLEEAVLWANAGIARRSA